MRVAALRLTFALYATESGGKDHSSGLFLLSAFKVKGFLQRLPYELLVSVFIDILLL